MCGITLYEIYYYLFLKDEKIVESKYYNYDDYYDYKLDQDNIQGCNSNDNSSEHIFYTSTRNLDVTEINCNNEDNYYGLQTP